MNVEMTEKKRKERTQATTKQNKTNKFKYFLFDFHILPTPLSSSILNFTLAFPIVSVVLMFSCFVVFYDEHTIEHEPIASIDLMERASEMAAPRVGDVLWLLGRVTRVALIFLNC